METVGLSHPDILWLTFMVAVQGADPGTAV